MNEEERRRKKNEKKKNREKSRGEKGGKNRDEKVGEKTPSESLHQSSTLLIGRDDHIVDIELHVATQDYLHVCVLP